MDTFSPPSLREATLQDYRGIAALEARHDMTAITEECWRHFWTANPAFRQGWPIGWVLADCEGTIVGSVGNIPLRYYFGERELTVSAGRAWVVDSSYRTFAALLMETYFDQRGVDLFLTTTLMPTAAPVFAAFGQKRVPVGAWDTASLLVTNYFGFAESALCIKGVKQARWWKYPAGAALYLHDVVTRKRPRAATNNLECSHHFDSGFEEFWRQLRQRRPDVLLADRSKRALDWHFRFSIGSDDLWVVTARENGAILAYAIFQRIVNGDSGLVRTRLIDYQNLSEDDWLTPMLAFAHQNCRKSGLHSLDVIGTRLSGWHHRKLTSWRYHYNATDPALAVALENPSAWNPSLYDGNASL